MEKYTFLADVPQPLPVRPAKRKDWSNKAGTEALAAKVREFWGGKARVWVEKTTGVHDGGEHDVWQIRSDLLNGQPRR